MMENVKLTLESTRRNEQAHNYLGNTYLPVQADYIIAGTEEHGYPTSA